MTTTTNRVLFTLCRHCGKAISLNPAEFLPRSFAPDWSGRRYWCHFQVVDDEHLPEPKRPFIDHLITLGTP